MIIYFIRHGETDWNKEWKLQGRTDTLLNENGRKVARLTRDALVDIPFQVAFTSPLKRARETAEILLEDRDIPIIDEERIIELSFGIFEGTTPDENNVERRAFFEDPGHYKAPEGGEEIIEMFERERDFLEELMADERYQDSTILVSTHGAALNGLLSVLKNNSPAQLWDNGLHKNCGITVVKIEDGRVSFLQEAVVLYGEE